MGKIPVVLIPGMGCVPIKTANFYGWLEKRLEGSEKYRLLPLHDWPDAQRCRASIWLPHLEHIVKGEDEESILVGHSSGAVCAARFAERHKIRGIVCCAGYGNDLGDENERTSEYFDEPWNASAITNNTDFRIVISGTKDHLVPFKEGMRFSETINADWIELKKRGHFFNPPFEELIDALDERCC